VRKTAAWKLRWSALAPSNSIFPDLSDLKNPATAGFFIGVKNYSTMQRLSLIPAIIPAMNADPLELQKFSDLAHRWWDPTSEFRPLHEINPLRLEWINARAPLAGKTIVDVGCGGGILAESMAKKGAKVTGIDLSEKALKVADLHSLESGVQVRYEMIPAEQLAAREPGRYDIITCMEMLEHVPDPAAIVQACATWSSQEDTFSSQPSTAIRRLICSP
jgi:2-polyprenyl-3-methyl-5-hydroxy-6-metoxy-1,4-benzoquinol methylase